MADIFLSYSREDQDRIFPLVKALESQGWSVFWDREIPAGKTWRSYIGQAILDAKCIIVAWSKDSVNSQWVSEEAEEAKKRGVLIPILLDAVEQPLGFRSIQAADLSDWRPGQPSPRFDRLLRNLAGLLGSAPEPAASTSAPSSLPITPPSPNGRKLRRMTVIAAVGVALIGGGYVGYSMWPGGAQQSPVEAESESLKPRIIAFKAQPTSITAGQRAQLEWQVADARSVKVDPDVGAVEGSGTKRVMPTRTTTYTLTAQNAVGQVQAMARVEVAAAPPDVSLQEDCLSLNPNSARLVADGSKWLLTDGSSRMKIFDVKAEGQLALRIIKHYGLNKRCFVGRPQPSMTYYLVNGQAPSGALAGEDCIGFNPSRLVVRKETNSWLLTDGSSRMMTFPNEEEAEKALAIIKKYGFTRTCYVGRPDPSMIYFRK